MEAPSYEGSCKESEDTFIILKIQEDKEWKDKSVGSLRHQPRNEITRLTSPPGEVKRKQEETNLPSGCKALANDNFTPGNYLEHVIHWIKDVITSLPLRERGVVFNLVRGILVLCIGIKKAMTSINTLSWTWNEYSIESILLFDACVSYLTQH
jgi:hypothetical protein